MTGCTFSDNHELSIYSAIRKINLIDRILMFDDPNKDDLHIKVEDKSSASQISGLPVLVERGIQGGSALASNKTRAVLHTCLCDSHIAFAIQKGDCRPLLANYFNLIWKFFPPDGIPQLRSTGKHTQSATFARAH